MRHDRVEAHDGPMLTNFDTAQAMVAHHQQQLRDEAGRRRLVRFARRARHSVESDGADHEAVVHRLPRRDRLSTTAEATPPEERAAS